MLYLVSYDVADDRRRNRLAKALMDFGVRVQYSVFECLLDVKLLEKMQSRITSIIDSAEDSIRVYTICAACERNLTIFGQGKKTQRQEIFIV